MGNLKAPGPDGFHPIFFMSQWEVVGPSLHQFVEKCFTSP
ncbi:non-LTR retroelement reverse transcriptase, partial [Trifolium medium]|nr:non-LTR retroelement reverse transcriptase [Trifolium medium]